jgi:hypothetical protein
MTAAILLFYVTAAPELFDVATIPAHGEDQQVFFAAIDDNRTADIVVQSGHGLYIRLDSGRENTFAIPEGVSAYDIYDIDGDGRSEVIAIRGREVLAFDPMLPSTGRSADRLLFEADSLYAMQTAEPYRQVLVKTFQQQLVILLPQPKSLVAHSLDGFVSGEFLNLTDVLRYTPEFTSRSWFQDGRMAPDTNLTSITQDSEMIPALPPELQPPDKPHTFSLSSTYNPNARAPVVAGFKFKAGDYAGTWDGIVVSKDSSKIRFAMLKNDAGNTLVFQREVPLTVDGEDWAGAKNGPVRRYPGRLVSERWWIPTSVIEQYPDFDGDGYMDLILWNAPQPGMSVDSIMRTVIGRTWPIRFTVHLYSPDKQRFEPKPAHAINCKVPVTWFLERGPIHNLSLADFDGDGKTDIALSTDEKEYKVWLAANGFAGNADWTHVFPEPIEELLQTADLSGNGRTSILLRGEKNLYLLQAR